ncbi:MAG: hypothetical protein AB1609_02155 [Bacillota bacterium]
MEYRQLTGSTPPSPLDGEAYRKLSPQARMALLTLLFSRASLPAPELAGIGADQALNRVTTFAGNRQKALAALWEARRAGLLVLVRERRYDLYLLPDESREALWSVGARELRARRPPITFVVESSFSQERFDLAGVEAASALLYDLAALIAFVRSEEASLGPGGHLPRKAQARLMEYLSTREPLPQDTGPTTSHPPRMGFLLELARRAGLVQASQGEPEFLQEGPVAAAWLQASPGRRLARVMAAFATLVGGSEVDGLIALDAARWMAAPGRGVWVKGFAEAVSHFEDEPFPAYRLVSLIKTLQKLSWLGAVFMWKARWSEAPPESDQAGNVSIKPAPSQRKGLPPLADVAFGLTSIGQVFWQALSSPGALLSAARLEDDAEEEARPSPAAAEHANGLTSARAPWGNDGPEARSNQVQLFWSGGDAADGQSHGPRLDEKLSRVLPADEPSAFIQPNFEILAPRHMRPDRLSRLIELSQVTRPDRMVQLKLDVERAAACVRSGRWTPAEVIRLLEESSRHELPQNVHFTLAEALKPLGRVQLMDGILVRADESPVAAAILESAKSRAIPIERISPEVLWIERRHVGALLSAAEASGYPVRPWVRGTRVAYPAQRASEVAQALENAARLAAKESGQLIERRPPPSLARGRRDLSYVPPGNEPELVAPALSRRGGAAGWSGSASVSRSDELGL